MPANATLCIACTLVLTILEERTLHEEAAPLTCERLGGCAGGLLPSPDKMCVELDLCDGQCALFPPGAWPPPPDGAWPAAGQRRLLELPRLLEPDSDDEAPPLSRLRAAVVAAADRLPAMRTPLLAPKVPDPCGLNITCLVNRIGTLHLPLLDDDGDAFAPVGDDSLVARRGRGSHWRGADCNDLSATVYPGRKAGLDLLEDTNCNGIHGGGAGIPSYEEKFCAKSQPRGLIALGDSATGANFD